MARTLVVHPGALGDVLLAVPALRALRARDPGDRLTLAAQPGPGGLLAALGVVDEAAAFESLGLEALFVDDGQRPEVPALERAARVVSWFGAGDPVFVARLRSVHPGAVVASATGDGQQPVWRHLLGTVGAADERREPIAVSPALLEEGEQALETAGCDRRAPLLVVHPGAGGLAKRWPVEGFVRVLEAVSRRRSLTVVIHQGPADAEAALALGARLASARVMVEPSLPRLAGALCQAAAYLGNDSGVSHLAAAVGTPAVVLFAAAALRWRPWSAVARPVVVAPGVLRRGDLEQVAAAVEAALPG